MQTYRLTLRPLSALGTPMAGDTLFGQLCWTLRHQLGNDVLTTLLQGYTQGRPFAVVSDAMPSGHIPLPTLPSGVWHSSTDADRKSLKKKRWLPLSDLHSSLSKWQQLAVSDAMLGQSVERAQPHNTINRRTGTTGTGMFAPYTTEQTWLALGSQLDVVVALDEDRLTPDLLQAAFDYIGQQGFGRDASIGLGKFERLGNATPVTWDATVQQPAANAWLTLGPCAPQGQGYCPVRSHWSTVTRFGRHGDVAVQTGQPFKRPVLMARAGSVFWPDRLDSSRTHIGQGLGGADAPVSLALPTTVHQGYAPAMPIYIPEATVSDLTRERA